ncbi:MAG: hypothetical protein RIM80_02580, partial [Alphaproteobacteria bacterium]
VDHVTDAGETTVGAGEIVQAVDGFGGTGEIGHVYRFVGPSQSIDLASTDFTDAGLWVDVTDAVAAGGAVDVNARIENRPDVTASAEVSEPGDTPGGVDPADTSKFGGAVAVAVGNYTNTAEAYIGAAASVDAGDALTVKSEALNDFAFAQFINLFDPITGFNNPDIDHETSEGEVTVDDGAVVRTSPGFAGTGDENHAYRFRPNPPADFTAGGVASGVVTVSDGTKVLVGDGWFAGKGDAGHTYEFIGAAAGLLDLDLAGASAAEDFTNTARWLDLGPRVESEMIDLASEDFSDGSRWADLGELSVAHYSADGAKTVEDGDLVR